jgi:hypothetical protein
MTRLHRRTLDRVDGSAALFSRRNGVRIARRIDERDLRGALAALVEDTPAGLFPDDLELRGIGGDDVGAPLHDAEPVVERVTELGDVEIRDVRDDER